MSGRRAVDALSQLGHRGATRLRSNVSQHADWGLVPGELVAVHRPLEMHRARPGTRQRDERDYYTPCAICDRTVARLLLEGCRQCSDAPAPEMVADVRARHEAVVREARELEAKINARLGRRAHAARIS